MSSSISSILDSITVNEQSSIRLEAAGAVVRFDPFELSGEMHDTDVIFITHPHHDHFQPESVGKAAKPDTVVVFPESMRAEVQKLGLAKEKMIGVRPGDRGEVCGICYEAVPAYNLLKPFHPKINGWVGYVITADGVTVYVAGDTDTTAEAKKVRCDIALLPIGGKYTVGPKEAAKLADAICPEAVVPTHYGSIVGSPEDFQTFSEALTKTKAVKKLDK